VSEYLPGKLLLDPEVIEDPYPFYRRLHAEAPVWRVPGTEVFVASSFDAVTEATARVDEFSSHMKCLLYRGDDGIPERLSFGDSGVQTLATADPPDHSLHRSTVFPQLVAKRMTTLEPDVVEIAIGCVERALDAGRVDFMASIGNVVPITVISRLIGFRDSDPDVLLQAAFDSTRMLGSTLTLPDLEALIGGVFTIQTWIGEQLALAADDPGENLLGTIARGVESGVFGDYEAAIMLHTLLSAGGESTTSLLGSAVRILADRPALQDRLRGDLTLVPAFVEEALRLESPFRYLMRWVPRETSLGGVAIPAGATLLLFWGAANRDAAEHDHPDEVDLERRVLRQHVAFGRGIHHCVGAPLARLEAKVVLSVLLERTTRIALDLADPPRWVPSLLIRRYERLPVQLVA
jgi:cytochrome P450